jgi:hypothetical protein
MAEWEKFIDYLHFSSHEDLIQRFLFGDLKITLEDYIFRGVGIEEYDLIPSVLRKEQQKELQIKVFGKNATETYYQRNPELESHQQNLEFSMLFEFYSLCDLQGLSVPDCKLFTKTNRMLSNLKLFSNKMFSSTHPTEWLPEDMWELAALAQHYGIPTRLLDWSRDLFTALFFASISGLKERNFSQEKNISLWAFNLGYIESIHLTNKTFPLKAFVPSYFSNQNLQAQSGVLTLWSTLNNGTNSKLIVDRRPLNEQLIDYFASNGQKPFQYPFFYKITLPHTELKPLLNVLDRLNYTESRSFPGYRGAAMRVLNQHYRKS